MICEDVEKKVLGLAEGTLSETERKGLEAHVSNCIECEFFTIRFIELHSGMHSIQTEELPPQFWPKLHQRIREYDAAEAERRGRLATFRVRLRPLLASACLLLGIWSGIQLGSAYAVRVSLQGVQSATSTSTEEPMPYLENLGSLPPGSLSEIFAYEYLDERSKE